ncbi:DUF1572 family protein [Paenibacillus athensensis]|uniref:DUF1572 domain-containing protein n=1 Tax=Paenibacillus athensensis TaxID=1967502 RepID=A0A4Y8Q8V5_9BACL|nr:DUF1572 family protein [Paenibacillus athensensis]MCD1260288.1 DUF1572 family protein [Paenibacillus athensensis]
MSDMEQIGAVFLEDTIQTFRSMKKLADGAMQQLGDAQFFLAPDAESNSLAIIIQHVHGNMLSRWRDFLTTDGEKPDRNRDGEFEPRDLTREELLKLWEEGWSVLFGALEPLGPGDLLRTVTIRGEAHTVIKAIQRQVSHYAYHVGQIVYLGKHLAGEDWQTLSIARGQSKLYRP